MIESQDIKSVHVVVHPSGAAPQHIPSTYVSQLATAAGSALQEECLHETFTAQAARTPETLALVCGDARLTYRELDHRSNQLAHALLQMGIRAEDRVGISLERATDLIVAVLGALKAGAAYVPIDPTYPTERIAFMLADARVAVTLTQANLVARLPLGATPVIALDHDWPQIAQHAASTPRVEASARNLAYIIYTSGSTGKPKGVGCEHRGVLNLLAVFEQRRALPVGAPCSLWTNISFDVSVYEMFSALLFGRTLHIVPDTLRVDSAAFFQWMHDQGIQSAYIPPFMLPELAQWAGHHPAALALRRVLVGVEPIDEAVLIALARAIPDVLIMNGYGPTEATVCATLYQIDPQASYQRVTPIGLPDDHTPVYLLDESLQQVVPAGTRGEIYIGGVQLARGYFQQPALTAERFIPDPFSAVAGARMYRTGDLAYYLDDGNIAFAGRVDQQVKLRGYRIELGEIESVLLRAPQVRGCLVLVREDVPGDQRIVAYVLAAADGAVTVGDLRNYLEARLPAYMVPAAYVVLDAFPLTPNDKIDHKALPVPDLAAHATGADLSPHTPLEATLATIWAAVLRLDHVGMHDNFFALGGHSLLATRLVAHIRERLDRDVPLSALFAAPTVAELAVYVATLAPDEPTPTNRILPVQRDRPLPLSPAQERLWFFDQLAPLSNLYHVPITVRLRREVDSDLLRQSVQTLVQRHESLRTTFHITANGPVQVIAPSVMVPLPEIDLRGWPEAEQEDALQLQMAAAQTPFDLTTGPLLRMALICLADQEYVLVVVQHHIITDDWSVDVLLRDLLAIYDALRMQQPVALPELPIKYVDYALWHRTWLQSAAYARQVAYWIAHLADAPAVLNLPTDHPRPPVLTYHGARHSFTVAAPLAHQLQALSKQEGVTLYMTLLAAFETFLMRITRQSDFVVGTVVAGRTTPEVEAVLGFFVNTLPLHVDLTGDPTFRDLLVRTRAIVLGAFDHQDVPFERIVDAVHPDRDLSYHPVIQVMFVLQNTALGSLETAAGELQVVELASSTSQFDVTLEMAETPQGLRGTFRYNTDLFAPATVQRLAEQYVRLLTGIVAVPQQRLSHLPLLTDEERHTLLVARNATRADFALEPFVPQAFARQVIRDPAALAIIGTNERLTYAEVNRRANQLAHRLLQLGVGPEALVGVCLNRSAGLIVALMGILKAGCAYVPLDPAYPAERRAYILEDARATVLIAQPSLVADLPPGAYRLLDPTEAALEEMPDADPNVQIFADNLVYVIYTSGSTGKPKGVQITHGSLRNLVTWYRQAFHITPQDHMSQLASPGFDATIMEIWPCLTSGASLHIADEDTRIDPTQLRDWLVAARVTVSMITTALAEQVVVLDWPANSALRVLLTGADALRVYPPDHFPATFVNNYGPTEGTVLVASGRISPTATPEIPPALGRSIANTRLYLLDDHLQPVPDGVPGELYIGGAQVARGYGGRPDLTAERFIPDPFSGEPGARLYRTGDLCRYLPDGEIAFVGRTDHQIKIRGFRIEQGEIETTLREHPAVNQALVVVQEETTGDKRLVAYVVAHPAGATDASAVRAFLHERLPGYMVPAAIVMLDELPMTPNGKVDRNALPMPVWQVLEMYVAPRSSLEESIARIWADVLHVERVGVEDNFFTLGGHSLRATQVIAHVRAEVQHTVPLHAVFTHPTVAEFAAYVATLTLENPAPAESFSVVRRDRPLPLSSAQERLWFFDQLEPNSTLYLTPIAVRLKRTPDLRVLEQSLQAIVQRHESLRTAFVTTSDGPVQIISPTLTVPLQISDLRMMTPEERAAAVRQHIFNQSRTLLPLQQAPLLRVVALQLADDETLILLTQHHIITDGWSVEVLLREWFTTYDAWTNDHPVALPELAIQYADYARWQRQWLQSSHCASQIAYWKHQLSDVPAVLDLPTDHPRPARQTYRGATYSFALAQDLAEQVQLLSRQAGATLFITLLAAFETLLLRYSGQTEFCVGSAFAGRTHPELEGILGFFVNTLPLRADLSANPSFRELLAQTGQVVIEAQAHQDVPLDVVVEAVRPERDASRHPLFQVLFTVQQAMVVEQQIAGLSVESLDWQSTTAKFDLTLVMTQSRDTLQGILEYNTDLFDHATIARMMGHFTRLLEGIVTDPDERLSELPLLSARDHEQMLVEWTATAREYPRHESIHRLFEAQVMRTPDAPAVLSGSSSMTYAELNQRANRLARYLMANGAHEGARIGVCMERSLDFVVSVVAILKIGGAYVPLDPTYPHERLAFMIADTQTPLILTQAKLRDVLPASPANVVGFDVIQAELTHFDAGNLTNAGAGASAAYVMYTSGSTGQPKGVVIPHNAVARLVLNTDYINLTPADRIAHISNISFDAATFEIWGALLNGAGLVVIPRDVVIAFTEFATVLRDQACSVMFTTTALFNQLASTLPAIFSSLQTVLMGGDTVDPQSVRRVLTVAPPQRLLHVYGPTENTTFSTWFEITTVAENAVTIPIGRAIANTTTYVLDGHMQPVPIGVAGELYLGGAGLAIEYLHRPEITEERFVPHPFSAEAGMRLYKTGDVVRYLPDGTIEFIGRRDQQVKLRGFRIELGEIEAVLNQHPHVSASHVMVREDVPGNKYVVAYAVPVSASSLTISDLRQFLQARLPAYMIPAAFSLLDSLPITPNGKLDRRALPPPDLTAMVAETYSAPRTDLEQKLAEIWAEILQVRRVGTQDNFFDLGGHSLLATRVISQIRTTCQIDVPLRVFFENATIAGLADYITHSSTLTEDARVTNQIAVVHRSDGDLSDLIEMLAGLSDDDARRLLDSEEAMD